MRPWVKEHRHIPPGVPLILPFGGHLVSHVLIDFVQHRVPARLVGLLVELLNQRRVNGDLQILVVFLDGLFQLAHHALGGVKLVTGSQLAQDGGRLYRLTGGGLHLRVEGKQLRRGLPVSRVGGVDEKLLAQGSDVFGHDALAHRVSKLLKCTPKFLFLYSSDCPVYRRLIAHSVIGQLPAQHHVLDVPHHLVRDGFCPHGGGGGLADAAALGVCGRHVHRTGRVGPFGEELALGALELRPGVETLPRRAHRALRAMRLGRPDASLVLHWLPRTFHDGIQLLDVRIVILERPGKLRTGVLRVCLVVAPDQSIEFVISNCGFFWGEIHDAFPRKPSVNYKIEQVHRRFTGAIQKAGFIR